jgi:L-xylulokinase
VLEGMIFNHRYHVEALTSAFPARRAGLTGGGSASPMIALSRLMSKIAFQ